MSSSIVGEKRQSKRLKRRIPVSFWQQKETRKHTGFTTNISPEGAFVCVGTPVPPERRVTLELGDAGHRVFLEAEVVHAARVPPVLQQLRPSGMGVRFLSVEELVAELLGDAPLARDEAGEEEIELEDVTPEVEEIAEVAEGEPKGPGEEGYWVRFATPEEFLQAVVRDLQHGGLFVPTADLAAVDSEATVHLVVPGFEESPLEIPSRVVRSLTAEQAEDGVAGVNLAFVDMQKATAALKDLVLKVRSGNRGTS